MSNVPTWLRSLSSVEYIYQTFQLSKLVVRIVHNSAGKYKDTCGAIIIKDCERALYHGRVANRIKIVDAQTYHDRLYELNQMREEVDNVATWAFIWFENIRNNDGIDSKTRTKTFKWEEQVGDLSDNVIQLIDGVIRNDRKNFQATIND